MAPRGRAPPRALVPTEARGPDPVAEAQARLREVLQQVAALDAEVEALSAALATFAAEVELPSGPGYLASLLRLTKSAPIPTVSMNASKQPSPSGLRDPTLHEPH